MWDKVCEIYIDVHELVNCQFSFFKRDTSDVVIIQIG